MLLNLAAWLQGVMPEWGFLRIFQYITFRAVMAAMTALLIGIAFGPWVIRCLTELKIGQPVCIYAMQTHLAKNGTPTMGGVLVLLAIAVATLLWFDLSNRFVWIAGDASSSSRLPSSNSRRRSSSIAGISERVRRYTTVTGAPAQ